MALTSNANYLTLVNARATNVVIVLVVDSGKTDVFCADNFGEGLLTNRDFRPVYMNVRLQAISTKKPVGSQPGVV
jgi:hypothetical protein